MAPTERDPRDLAAAEPAEVVPAPDEPPVAARLVVEIRTDGTRTVARGALEDAILGERVAVKVEGTTPLSLALALAKAMFQAPLFARTMARAAAKALLPGRAGGPPTERK